MSDPTPPPAALTPEQIYIKGWSDGYTAMASTPEGLDAQRTRDWQVFQRNFLTAPPPARAVAPEGELERLRAEVTHYREAALEVGCLDGHFVVQLVQTLRAENTRLTEALEQATRERDGLSKDYANLLKQSNAYEIERDQQAGALVTLREALEKALAGIDDVAAQASLCAHHVVPHEHQRTWLRSEVRREADGAQRAIRAALAASAPASTPEEG
jgi:hypothetical protein